LHARKIKNVHDFLRNNCPFTGSAPVYFYEVNYTDDRQEFLHIFTGTVLAPTNSNLGDDADTGLVNSNNSSERNNNFTLVAPTNDATSKTFVKSQAEQIQLLTKINADDRMAFDKERKEFIKKIDELNNRIVDLNITINTLEADKRGLEIRCEEKERLLNELLKRPQEAPQEEPQGLADRGVAMLDSMLGDGASQLVLSGLATGIGNGVSKLIEAGIDYARYKGVLPKQEQAQPVVPVMPVVPSQAQTLQPTFEQNNLTLEDL
jgi:hypothetical protein